MTDEVAEKRRQQRKLYREANREHVLAYAREYYKRNKETILARCKEWRAANPERVRENRKKWESDNREKRREINKRWFKTPTGKAALARNKKKRMQKLGQSIGASRLVHCFSCRSVYGLEDAVHRGWKLIGRHGCLCDLCQ